MADMEWLENNAYTRTQTRSANLTGALAFLFLALLWSWPVSSIWKGVYCVLQADANCPVEGYVESYRDGYKKSHLTVAIEYRGETYTVVRQGYMFTRRQFENAIKSRRVTVYVNHDNPAESVMSLGIPLRMWIITVIVTLPVVAGVGASLYFFCYYRRNCRKEVEDVES